MLWLREQTYRNRGGNSDGRTQRFASLSGSSYLSVGTWPAFVGWPNRNRSKVALIVAARSSCDLWVAVLVKACPTCADPCEARDRLVPAFFAKLRGKDNRKVATS